MPLTPEQQRVSDVTQSLNARVLPEQIAYLRNQIADILADGRGDLRFAAARGAALGTANRYQRQPGHDVHAIAYLNELVHTLDGMIADQSQQQAAVQPTAQNVHHAVTSDATASNAGPRQTANSQAQPERTSSFHTGSLKKADVQTSIHVPGHKASASHRHRLGSGGARAWAYDMAYGNLIVAKQEEKAKDAKTEASPAEKLEKKEEPKKEEKKEEKKDKH